MPNGASFGKCLRKGLMVSDPIEVPTEKANKIQEESLPKPSAAKKYVDQYKTEDI